MSIVLDGFSSICREGTCYTIKVCATNSNHIYSISTPDTLSKRTQKQECKIRRSHLDIRYGCAFLCEERRINVPLRAKASVTFSLWETTYCNVLSRPSTDSLTMGGELWTRGELFFYFRHRINAEIF